MNIREGLTFDDVLLVPKFSDVTSRSQTDLSTQLSRNISINIPLISANMDTVTEASMAVTIAREGGIGIIHRFLTIQEEVNEVHFSDCCSCNFVCAGSGFSVLRPAICETRMLIS